MFQLSDPTGQFEAIIFQEGLAKYRDDLEKGAEVMLTLQASVEGEDVRAVLRLFDEHGVGSAFYAHASAGCLHIRPVINLKNAEGVARMKWALDPESPNEIFIGDRKLVRNWN